MNRREALEAAPLDDDTRAEEDAAHARCVAYVRAHARGPVEGLYGPGSLAWEMYREVLTPVSFLSAVLLQMAHPAIAAGVAQHSTFVEDMRGRAYRTSASFYGLLFGSLDEVLAGTRKLHAMHRAVRGRVTDRGVPGEGEVYRANDQALLRWVAATVSVAGRASFETFVRPLTMAEREEAHRAMVLANAAVGVLPESLPPDAASFDRWYQGVLDGPELVVGDTARCVVDNLRRRPLLHPSLDALATAAFLPPRWREAFGFRWGPREEDRFQRVVRVLRASLRALPAPYRYVIAWHQAEARVRAARGEAPSRWSVAVDRIGRRWSLPTALTGL
jgi:uncharacterized protein (DUF2236 family)